MMGMWCMIQFVQMSLCISCTYRKKARWLLSNCKEWLSQGIFFFSFFFAHLYFLTFLQRPSVAFEIKTFCKSDF